MLSTTANMATSDHPNPGFPKYRIDIEPDFVAIEVELPTALHLTDKQVTHLEARLYDAVEAVLSSALTISAINAPSSEPSLPELPEPDWEAWERQLADTPPVDLT
jgi:hypothetical protein